MRFKHYNYKITSPTFFFGEFNALGYFTCTDPKQHSVSKRRRKTHSSQENKHRKQHEENIVNLWFTSDALKPFQVKRRRKQTATSPSQETQPWNKEVSLYKRFSLQPNHNKLIIFLHGLIPKRTIWAAWPKDYSGFTSFTPQTVWPQAASGKFTIKGYYTQITWST